METRSGVFAVAIIVLLLMALTMSSVSAESKAKVKLGPSDMEKGKLNHTDAAKDTPKHSDAAKDKLNHTDATKVALNPSESMTFPTERALNELIYDDGTAEDAYAWSWPSAGNGFAVRFTPLSYPVDILTARICFWHDDWPDSDHEEFAVYVYDDDGPGGEPGTCLAGPILHTAAAWGWCDVDIPGPGITIENGDFYILYEQRTNYSDCEGLCVDKSLPHSGRSWDYAGGSWYLWAEENYMIRCVVDDDTTDEWTYMVYLDGDNNLEGAAIDDFMEMSSVGSTSDVNIVVQFDRIPGHVSSYGDWTTCKRFHVTSGMTPTAANAISDLDECNMGDPDTLDAFVTWAMAEFPADNYALILWNHGDGWKSINNWVPWADDTKEAKDAGSSRGICVDDTDNDYLSLQETEQALTGKYVQLLGYDACLMHMIEVVYQVMANARISAGSEEVEPWDGWPYDTILADLAGTPTMSEYTLGEVIVDRYMDSYGYTGSETQSAVDNLELQNLVAAVDNLAQALINEINGGNLAQVQQARNAAAEIYYTYYIDLYHFAEMVDTYTGATAEALAVMDSVGVAVYEEAHGSSVPNDHGLSIYFPLEEGDYLASYDNTSFAVDTLWDEFLKEYYAPSICGNMNANPTSWSSTLNCSESDSQIVTVSATGGTVKGVTVSKVSGPTWLSVSPTNLGDIVSGSSKTFTMTASPPSETSGDFTYTVKVSNTCGTPSTRDVSGTIDVDCPELSYSPASHDFGDMCEGETDSTTFEVWNSGTGTLTYSLSETCDWVEVNPTSGSSTGEHDTITVDIDTTGLSEGSYICNISISSNGGNGTFTVTVNIIPSTGSIYVTSEPSGADISIDGSPMGEQTPCTITNVPAGTHTIKLTLMGYHNWTTNLQVIAGETVYVHATLTPLPKPDLIITEKWLCWPDNCTICYNVTNIGDGTAPSCHNTTLYVDGVAVAHDPVPVDLAPGESYTGCFNGYDWAYTPPSDNITVCADNNESIVELDEDNNCLTNIWMCGDVNGDRAVNVIDVVLIYKRALDPGYPLDLPWAGDVNCDRNINVIDVVMVYKRALDPGYDLDCYCEVV